MSIPLSLIWQQNGQVLDTPTSFAINYPGGITEGITLQVRSNSQDIQTFNNLVNVSIYLSGDSSSIQLVQQIWPLLGASYNPSRPDLNGGLDISFDGGQTYTRFNAETGCQDIPSTWITLPANSIGINGTNGVLGPFDIATFILRLVIPSVSIDYKQLNLNITLDFDVL